MQDSLFSIFIIRIDILSPLPSESGTDYLAMFFHHTRKAKDWKSKATTATFKRNCFLKSHEYPVGGFNPSEKYYSLSQIGNSPQIVVK